MTTDVARYGDDDRRPDLLDAATDSWVASVADVVKLAGYIADTPFVPAGLRGSAPATAATILYGREIGVPPITALQTMHVINGRVGMAAELMRARVLAAGHDIEVLESTAAVCRMRGRRRGSEVWTECQWSMGDARQAKLGGDNWTKYPRAMLVARCSAELCRLVFPDVTHGMAATEELDGMSSGVSSTPTAPPATAPKRVSRAPRTPSPGAVPAPPVAAPEPDAEPARVVSETPPPGEGVPVQGARTNPPPVVVPDPEPPPPSAPEPTPPPLPIPEPEPAPADPEADPRVQAALTGDGPATQAQVRHVMVLLRKLGVGQTRDERLWIGQGLVERRVQSFSELSVTDAGRMITTLLLALDSDNPRAMLRWIVDESHERMAAADAEVLDAAAATDAEVLDQ